MNKLVTIKFSVNRKRDGWDEYPQIVKCEITRDLSYAKKIDLSSDDYDDNAYDRFCDRVPVLFLQLQEQNVDAIGILTMVQR